jgi:hypothetical protein
MSDVCKSPYNNHTKKICIDQILEHQNEINKFFTILSNHCEHRCSEFCQIPLEIYPVTGVIICEKPQDCPLLKEEGM